MLPGGSGSFVCQLSGLDELRSTVSTGSSSSSSPAAAHAPPPPPPPRLPAAASTCLGVGVTETSRPPTVGPHAHDDGFAGVAQPPPRTYSPPSTSLRYQLVN